MSQNSFKGANLDFPNSGIHFMLAEIIKFRKQLTMRDEFRSQSGWTDNLNVYMITELEKLRDTLENIISNPSDASMEELEARAADTERTLASDYDLKSLSSDNILMPVGVSRQIVWDLTGANPDIPQINPENCPNDTARSFITFLDTLFTTLTRLDSRFQTQTIMRNEGAQMVSQLETLYAITQRKGGEVNKSDIPSGTLPSQEEDTFMFEDQSGLDNI